MKTKKSFGIYIVLAMMGIGLLACSEEYKSRLPELIVKDMDFSSGRSTKEQVFRNEDLSNYSIASNADWCYPDVDVPNSRITVTVAENETYDARTAIVTMTDIKDATMRTFNVSQLQKDGLLIDSTSYDVPMEGGTVSIKVESNVSYNVIIPASDDWITRASNTRGLETSTVTLNIAKNNSNGVREGSVTISNTESGLSSTITIRQQFQALFSVDITSIESDEFGGEFQIPVQTNIAITSYINGGGRLGQEWATLMTRTWVDDENFIENVHVEPFKEKKKQRTCYVVLENSYWEQSQVVSLTQYRPLFIESNSVIELEAKERLALDLYNRDNLEVKWESSNEKVATVNANGVIEGVGDGECTITVTSADGKRSDYVMVVVNVPIDPTSQVKCRWAYKYAKDQAGNDSVSAVGCTFINNSDVFMYMQSSALYNDGIKVSGTPDYGSPGEVVSANGGKMEFSSAGLIDIDSGKGYYVQWVFICNNTYYTLKFDQDGEYYITQSNSSTRSRSSVVSRKKR